MSSPATAVPDVLPRRRLPAVLPRGGRLDEGAFAARHAVLWWLLVLHVPVLSVLGLLHLRDGGAHAQHGVAGGAAGPGVGAVVIGVQLWRSSSSRWWRAPAGARACAPGPWGSA